MITTEREILRTLTEREQLHVVDLAEEIDEHPMTVDHSCDRLHRSGRVQLVGPGLYTLNERAAHQ